MALELQFNGDKARASVDAIEASISKLKTTMSSLGTSAGLEQLISQTQGFKGVDPSVSQSFTALKASLQSLTTVKLDGLVTALEKLSATNVGEAVDSIQKLVTALGQIQIPPGLQQIVTQMNQIGSAARTSAAGLQQFATATTGIGAAAAGINQVSQAATVARSSIQTAGSTAATTATQVNQLGSASAAAAAALAPARQQATAAATAATQLGQSSTQASTQVTQLATATTNAGKQMQTTAGHTRNLVTELLGVGSALAVISKFKEMTGEASKLSVEFENMRNKVQGFEGSTKAAADAESWLIKKSDELAVPVEKAAESFGKLYTSLRSTGHTLEESKTTWEGITTVIKASSVSTANQTRAMTEFTEILNGGKIGMQQVNAIARELGGPTAAAFHAAVEGMTQGTLKNTAAHKEQVKTLIDVVDKHGDYNKQMINGTGYSQAWYDMNGKVHNSIVHTKDAQVDATKASKEHTVSVKQFNDILEGVVDKMSGPLQLALRGSEAQFTRFDNAVKLSLKSLGDAFNKIVLEGLGPLAVSMKDPAFQDFMTYLGTLVGLITNSVVGAFKLLIDTAQPLVSIFTNVANALEQTAPGFGEATKNMVEMVSPTILLSVATLYLVGYFSAASTGATMLGRAFTTLKAGAELAYGAFVRIMAIGGGVVGPILLVAAAVAIMIVYWDKFSAAVKTAWDWMKKIGEAVAAFLPFGKQLVEALQPAVDKVEKLGTGFDKAGKSMQASTKDMLGMTTQAKEATDQQDKLNHSLDTDNTNLKENAADADKDKTQVQALGVQSQTTSTSTTALGSAAQQTATQFETETKAANALATALQKVARAKGGGGGGGGGGDQGGDTSSSPAADASSPDLSATVDGVETSAFSGGGISHIGTSNRVTLSASAFSSAPHFAGGGLSDGGIPAVLHPNEAVVPLTGGGAIPVDISGAMGGGGSGNTALLDKIDTLTAQQATFADVANQQMSELLKKIDTSNSNFELMIAGIDKINTAATSAAASASSAASSSAAGSAADAASTLTADQQAFESQQAALIKSAPQGSLMGGMGMNKRSDGSTEMITGTAVNRQGGWDLKDGQIKSSPFFWGGAGIGFAEGTPNTSSVSTDPNGFPVTIHPNEAVIPLPDGRTVPVTLTGNSSSTSSAIGGVTVNVTMTVNCEDANSFNKSKDQMLQELARDLERTLQNIGRTTTVDDPTTRLG